LATAALISCKAGGRVLDLSASSTLESEACSGVADSRARCYRLAVAENRSAPSRTIRLRIVIQPATGGAPQPDPVFFLAGGPGQAASSLLRERTMVSPGIARDRDMVFADQRGTGGSNSLDCQFYGPPDVPQSYFDKFLPLDKVRECRKALSASADLAQYTTDASVEDLEAIRVALGRPRINLIGGSYGTRLAMEYVRRYGEHVRTVTLESPVTASTHAPEEFGRFADRALAKLIDECARTPACQQAFPKLADEVKVVFDRLRQGSVTAMVAHPSRKEPARVTLTRDHVAEVVRYMMYSAQGGSYVPLYLHHAFSGNFEPIATFLIRWRAAGTFDGLYLSITCAEDVPYIANDAAEADEPTYLGSYRVRQQREACAEWPRGTVFAKQFEAVRSSVPILMTSGDLDPVTPAENADALGKTLPNSVHVRIPFSGHSPSGLAGLECLDEIKRTFIEKGGIEGLDTSCVSKIIRRGFATSW
jgi:pimeloyl-ACP methyl ester carboxylesterase